MDDYDDDPVVCARCGEWTDDDPVVGLGGVEVCTTCAGGAA